jgi:hypothetical protein
MEGHRRLILVWARYSISGLPSRQILFDPKKKRVLARKAGDIPDDQSPIFFLRRSRSSWVHSAMQGL